MKKYLVIGLGQTGLSLLTFLQKHQEKAIAFDTRTTLPNLDAIKKQFQCPCYLQTLPDSAWPDISEVLVSPGVDLQHPVILKAQSLGLSVIGDIELFYRKAQAPIIAITGTNAKSTVTSLTTQMIQACGKTVLMGGNIGIPALELLEYPTPDFYVLELSSFQLDLVRNFKAKVAVVLNLSPDHLDRHHTMEAYQQAKERIYFHCPHPIFNRAMHYFSTQKPAFTFGLSAPDENNAWGILDDHLALGQQKLLPVNALSSGLSGHHNLENALSALALISPLHLPLAPQIQVLRHFQGLPHRCVLVKTVNQVAWYNDSKGTNVGATLAAIKGIAAKTAGPLVLLLGGLAKDQDFTPLRDAIQQHVHQVIVYGQDRQKILTDLQGLPCLDMGMDFIAALKQAKNSAKAGGAVLFSPACASMDLFKNYEDRGEQFTQWVLLAIDQ